MRGGWAPSGASARPGSAGGRTADNSPASRCARAPRTRRRQRLARADAAAEHEWDLLGLGLGHEGLVRRGGRRVDDENRALAELLRVGRRPLWLAAIVLVHDPDLLAVDPAGVVDALEV